MVVGPNSIPSFFIKKWWKFCSCGSAHYSMSWICLSNIKGRVINEKGMQCKWIGGCVNYNYKFEKTITIMHVTCWYLINAIVRVRDTKCQDIWSSFKEEKLEILSN